MSLIAGSILQFNGGANTTVIGGFSGISLGGNTAGVLSVISTGPMTLFGGNNITLSQNGQSITLSGAAFPTQSLSAGGTTATGSAVSLDLEAGAFISFQTAAGAGALTVTVAGSNQSILFGATSIAGGSLGGTAATASSTAMQFIAGANIGISQLSTSPNITISGKNQVQLVSMTTAANGSTSGTQANITGSFVLVAGNQITLSQNSGTGTNSTLSSGSAAIMISGPSFSAGGGLAVTTGSVISYSMTNMVSSLNGSSGTLSISAGANIGIGQAANTITISASSYSTLFGIAAGLGATSGTLNTASSTAFALIAGPNITLSQLSTSPNITIVGPSPAGGGNTFTLNGTTNSVSISAGAGIGIGQAASTITISASVQTSSLSISAAGNTLGGANTSAAISNLVNISGAGLVSVGMNGSTITIAASTFPSTISYYEPFPLQEASPVLVGVIASTGTTAASAANNPFGSSLSLQRFWLPAAMNLSELDLAFGINFPATNQGAGSMSQSFMLYSFNNSSSLGSVVSASRTAAWASGSTTSGTASSLQQGWSGNMLQPMTFASSVVPPGEYVIANLLSWAAVNTSWTITVFGANAVSTITASAVTNIASGSLSAASTFATASQALTAWTASPTGANALSSNGLLAGSVHTASSSSSLTAWSAAPTGIGALSSNGLSGFATGIRHFSYTGNSTSGITMGATAAAGAVSGLSNAITGTFTTLAGSYHTGSGSGQALSNAGTSAFAGFLGSGGLLAGSFLTASGSAAVLSNVGTAGVSVANSLVTASIGAVTGVSTLTASSTYATNTVPSFGYNGSFAMTTNATQASYLWGAFGNGIMATGSMPTTIALNSTAVTVSGSLALIQPWFAMIGS